MSLPRLAGPRVALVPVPVAVARAALADPPATDVLTGALGELGLRAGSGWPYADTAEALRPLAEHGAAGDDGGWLVALDGEVVGECGWRGGPDHYGDALLVFGVAPGARRDGVGTEAVAVLCAWAERQPGVHRLVAEVLPGNEPSLRLLRRLGFVDDGHVPPCLRLTRTRTERVRGRHVC